MAKRKEPTFESLTAEYSGLWAHCQIRPERKSELERSARKIFAARPRYDEISKATGVPWFVIGIIHQMECGQNFKQHLHNGDSLTARTHQEPANRPAKGDPPFTFDESACDALLLKGLNKITDWSIERICYTFEQYNGWGYRWYRHIHSPYLWSYTTLYKSGKYVADGVWSQTAVSEQSGAMALLRTMIDMDATAIDIHQETNTRAWVKATPEVLPLVQSKAVVALQSRSVWSGVGAIISLVLAGVQEAADYAGALMSQVVDLLPSLVSSTKENVAAVSDLAQTIGYGPHVAKAATAAGVAFCIVFIARHVDLKAKKE